MARRPSPFATVHAFPRAGVRPLTTAYRLLADHLGVDAVAHAQAATPLRPSIVNGQIAAALRGRFGDVAFTSRTAGGELFVNPLMAVYFAVDLPALAASVHYLDRLRDTDTMAEVAAAIADHRTVARHPSVFPH
ncbi:hypothetical protein AB0A74_23490 [Saccharothrix sp. NPDC042600]|uniref:hypothetical protein n=1 Tax=Saccharothrix TaxID=2071 RepID=UPI0033F7E0FB|nr:hypothetical protein GCM10017745_69410 [Saccharothrix mutabilis subsp. capreolus]